MSDDLRKMRCPKCCVPLSKSGLCCVCKQRYSRQQGLTDAVSHAVAKTGKYIRDTFNASLYKAERNDPCPCGSGIKFKKCCIDKTVMSALGSGAINGFTDESCTQDEDESIDAEYGGE